MFDKNNVDAAQIVLNCAAYLRIIENLQIGTVIYMFQMFIGASRELDAVTEVEAISRNDNLLKLMHAYLLVGLSLCSAEKEKLSKFIEGETLIAQENNVARGLFDKLNEHVSPILNQIEKIVPNLDSDRTAASIKASIADIDTREKGLSFLDNLRGEIKRLKSN